MDKLRDITANVVVRAERTWRKLRSWRLHTPRTDQQGPEHGQGLAEYALILAGIAIVAIASLTLLGLSINGQFWDPIIKEVGGVLSHIGG